MLIRETKYVIATKQFPILFENDDCYDVEEIQKAAFYETYDKAEEEISRFDEPDRRQICKVVITYEL